MVYEYRIKGLYKAKAQVAGEVCERLERSPKGLSPKTLLDASRDPSDPLHGEFEWDDGAAAEKWRESQAAGIIRSLVVVSGDDDPENCPRAFVNVHIGGTAGAYMSIRRVVGNEELQAQMLKRAKAEMESFIAKYKRLSEIENVVKAMEKILGG